MKTASATLWVLAFLIAAGLSTLIPPMQSPDELGHISRAYLVSQGQLLLNPMPADWTGPRANQAKPSPEMAAFIERAHQNGGRIGGLVDLGLWEFIDAHSTLVTQADSRLSAEDKVRIAQISWTGRQHYLAIPGAGYYFPAVYIPQALGLAIGQLFNLSVEHSYQLARGWTLLACFAMLWLACKLVQPSPLAVAVLLLPMSVFQLLSPTIDGLTTSLAVLTISLFLRCADPDCKPAPALSWGLAICIFLLVTSRTHLLTLLVLPFFLAWRRRSRQDFYLGCWVTVAALGWVLFALYSTNDPRIARTHSTAELLAHYTIHPLTFLQVVFATLTNHELFTFYEQSFIGILGWLDTRLPEYCYPTLWLGLSLCALASVSVSTLRQDWHIRLLLAGAALASVGLIFLALLVTWTPHPATLVQGVQGRYFVVPMLLLGYALQGTAKVRLQWHNTFIKVIVTGFTFVSLWALITTLLSRYH